MSFFARPYVLIWRNDAWLAVSKQQYFQTLDEFNSTSNVTWDDALQRLAMELRQRSHKPFAILLPDEWLTIGRCHLDSSLPKSLYLLAAHTQVGQMLVQHNAEQMLSYMVSPELGNEMYVASLPKADLDALEPLRSTKVFSEGLIQRVKLPSWRRLTAYVKPFVAYSDDYLERRMEQRYRHTLLSLMVMVALLGSGLAYSLIENTPTPASGFQWPWPSSDHSQTDVLESLAYLRTLPASLRLDDVHISLEQIRLSVTGSATDLQWWQSNWPKKLPPLEIVVNGERSI